MAQQGGNGSFPRRPVCGMCALGAQHSRRHAERMHRDTPKEWLGSNVFFGIFSKTGWHHVHACDNMVITKANGERLAGEGHAVKAWTGHQAFRRGHERFSSGCLPCRPACDFLVAGTAKGRCPACPDMWAARTKPPVRMCCVYHCDGRGLPSMPAMCEHDHPPDGRRECHGDIKRA